MAEKYTGKEIYDCCFVQLPSESNKHICNACKNVVKADVGKYGYQNCKAHLKLNHDQDWEGWLKVYRQGGKGPIDKFLGIPSEKAKTIYDWIEWIVEDDHPFIHFLLLRFWTIEKQI